MIYRSVALAAFVLLDNLTSGEVNGIEAGTVGAGPMFVQIAR